jgi:hypothetical protein
MRAEQRSEVIIQLAVINAISCIGLQSTALCDYFLMVAALVLSYFVWYSMFFFSNSLPMQSISKGLATMYRAYEDLSAALRVTAKILIFAGIGYFCYHNVAVRVIVSGYFSAKSVLQSQKSGITVAASYGMKQDVLAEDTNDLENDETGNVYETDNVTSALPQSEDNEVALAKYRGGIHSGESLTLRRKKQQRPSGSSVGLIFNTPRATQRERGTVPTTRQRQMSTPLTASRSGDASSSAIPSATGGSGYRSSYYRNEVILAASQQPTHSYVHHGTPRPIPVSGAQTQKVGDFSLALVRHYLC